MKKKLTTIIAIILTVLLIGAAVTFFIVKRNKPTNLYTHCSSFLNNEDCAVLTSSIDEAHAIYNERVSPSETRLSTLSKTIAKLDILENDLNAYLIVSNKSTKAVKISNAYKSLTSKRRSLTEQFDDYIGRMSGNIEADEGVVKTLYNHMFDITADYLHDYNNCFKQTIDYTFDEVMSDNNIKYAMYLLYYHTVDELLVNISEHTFKSTYTLDVLNSKINIVSNNLELNDLSGGEFCMEARLFQESYFKSNTEILLKNFEIYYSEDIDETTETNIEKLTVFYLKKVL